MGIFLLFLKTNVTRASLMAGEIAPDDGLWIYEVAFILRHKEEKKSSM